jgi:hypothetical protein
LFSPSFGRALALIQPTADPIELVAARYGAAVPTLGRGDLLEAGAKSNGFLDVFSGIRSPQ